MMARKRAQQRWSALLSRIGKQVRLEEWMGPFSLISGKTAFLQWCEN